MSKRIDYAKHYIDDIDIKNIVSSLKNNQLSKENNQLSENLDIAKDGISKIIKKYKN